MLSFNSCTFYFFLLPGSLCWYSGTQCNKREDKEHPCQKGMFFNISFWYMMPAIFFFKDSLTRLRKFSSILCMISGFFKNHLLDFLHCFFLHLWIWFVSFNIANCVDFSNVEGILHFGRHEPDLAILCYPALYLNSEC